MLRIAVAGLFADLYTGRVVPGRWPPITTRAAAPQRPSPANPFLLPGSGGTSHYGAPTISVDRLLACAFGKPASWNADFDAAEQVKHDPPKRAAAPGPVREPPEAYPVGEKED